MGRCRPAVSQYLRDRSGWVAATSDRTSAVPVSSGIRVGWVVRQALAVGCQMVCRRYGADPDPKKSAAHSAVNSTVQSRPHHQIGERITSMVFCLVRQAMPHPPQPCHCIDRGSGRRPSEPGQASHHRHDQPGLSAKCWFQSSLRIRRSSAPAHCPAQWTINLVRDDHHQGRAGGEGLPSIGFTGVEIASAVAEAKASRDHREHRYLVELRPEPPPNPAALRLSAFPGADPTR